MPVKDFASAKQRLDLVLRPEDRRRLAEAMFRDVLGALTLAPDLDLIAIVTKDEQAISIATEIDVSVIRESENRGETEAVALATDVLTERGVQTMLVVPGDIPLITKEDVEMVIQAGRDADVVLVPAHDERGTNAVLLTPPNSLPLRFGNDSFRPHLESARTRGLRTTILHLPNVGLDVDAPADLATLANWPAQTRTHAVLKEMKWEAPCR
ncbi:MAG: 2-phospho-L-lactate guanylyltransferase [Acidobacteria bacterium]|nr:2-phospho-L-lactate guanylyltransferase [Acidobacteriota bacterium]